MIGILVTGHCHFASGLTSVLDMLAGPQEHYETVDFSPELPLEILERQISKSLTCLSCCESVLIFTDIKGGSPYNMCVRLQRTYPQPIHIISGTNLPCLITACLERQNCQNPDIFTEHIFTAGREGITGLLKTECTKPSIDEEDVDIE